MAPAVAVRTREGVTVPEAGTYQIDPAHSVLEFVVRHMGLAKVRGRFNEFEGAVHIDEDVTRSSAHATIQAASIDTRDETRDGHLRSEDFLDVDNHATLEFRSTGVRQENGSWKVDGELTIAGATRPVTFDVEFEGGARDPWGYERVGFSASATINREDFGLTWNQALETGGWMVSKEVELELSVEAVRQT
jgi:polyisoprenoid-binding protein YceI